MKQVFRPGDKKTYHRRVVESDQAIFHGELLHSVCSTFALARDFEWSSRLFFIEMKEEDEEGVGTFLSIEHKRPAFVGDEIEFIATIDRIEGMELHCTIQASVNGRVVAMGRTGQKMLKKERLDAIFTRLE